MTPEEFVKRGLAAQKAVDAKLRAITICDECRAPAGADPIRAYNRDFCDKVCFQRYEVKIYGGSNG